MVHSQKGSVPVDIEWSIRWWFQCWFCFWWASSNVVLTFDEYRPLGSWYRLFTLLSTSMLILFFERQVMLYWHSRDMSCLRRSFRTPPLGVMLTGPLTGVGAVIRFAGLNIEYWGKGALAFRERRAYHIWFFDTFFRGRGFVENAFRYFIRVRFGHSSMTSCLIDAYWSSSVITNAFLLWPQSSIEARRVVFDIFVNSSPDRGTHTHIRARFQNTRQCVLW